MINFIMFLLGKNYEPLEVRILREQLEYEREVNRELVLTLSSIVNPNRNSSLADTNTASVPVTNNGMWGRRRAALEQKDRIEASLKETSHNLAKPDKQSDKEVEKLEKELGIEQETKTEGVH